jgi:uncharacterized membrane protein
MEKPEVKFGDWIQQGFDLYKDNLGLLILASLLVVLLGAVTLGILTGPLMVGLILIVLGLVDKREPKPEVSEVFKGFEFFLDAFLFSLVWGFLLIAACFILSMIVCIGPLAAVFLSAAAGALLMFGLFRIADKKQPFWPASLESLNLVKTNFWPFLGFFLVAALIGSLGNLLCGLGAFLTLPIYVCITAVAYREVFNGEPPAVTPAGQKTADPGGETASAPEAEIPTAKEMSKGQPPEEEPPKEEPPPTGA